MVAAGRVIVRAANYDLLGLPLSRVGDLAKHADNPVGDRIDDTGDEAPDTESHPAILLDPVEEIQEAVEVHLFSDNVIVVAALYTP